MSWFSFFYHYIYFHVCYRLPLSLAPWNRAMYIVYMRYMNPLSSFIVQIIVYYHWYTWTECVWYRRPNNTYRICRTAVCDAMQRSTKNPKLQVSHRLQVHHVYLLSYLNPQRPAVHQPEKDTQMTLQLLRKRKCVSYSFIYQREWLWERRPKFFILIIIHLNLLLI